MASVNVEPFDSFTSSLTYFLLIYPQSSGLDDTLDSVNKRKGLQSEDETVYPIIGDVRNPVWGSVPTFIY